jgi:hypothetical protein
VPKCGGTSVDAALRDALGVAPLDGWINPQISRTEARFALGGGVPELAVPRWLEHRAYLLWHYLSEGRPFVSGHGPVSGYVLDRFADRTPFLTVLRDPVERWISYYRSSLSSSDDPNVVPNRLSALSPEEQLEKVLTSASGAYIGSFVATYLGGHRPYSDDDPCDAIEPALDALARFAVVGFTSDWGGFVETCKEALGLDVKIPHLNRTEEYERSSGSDIDALFTVDVRDRIASLCEADIAIYREARRLRGIAAVEHT